MPSAPSAPSHRELKSTTVFVAIEDLEDLRLVGLGVGRDFLGRERRPRLRPARRIADHPGEVADDEDHAMAEVLKVLHLSQQHGVAEMQIRRRGIEADFDRQRRAGLRRALELVP